jgi:hypothetical protein
MDKPTLTVEEEPGLHPNVLYLIMTIEDKISQFETVNLADFNKQLQAVEEQRQVLIARINQVQGAITGGRIMIEEELKAAGKTYEFYQNQKEYFLRDLERANKPIESGKKVLDFVPQQGQSDETVPRTDDDSCRADGE